MMQDVKFVARLFARTTAKAWVLSFCLGMAIVMLGANFIGALLGGVEGLLVARWIFTILGVIPHILLFYKYTLSDKQAVSVRLFILHYTAMFMLYLLPIYLTKMSNIPDIFFLEWFYTPQIDLWEWLAWQMNNYLLAWLAVVIIYMMCFIIASMAARLRK
ncbi:MAG: hypothetical protein FWC71_01385 [Defluviitaleaceae bacterium]|nr:hypothetical protein [Defluviitaleaceae bacterium]